MAKQNPQVKKMREQVREAAENLACARRHIYGASGVAEEMLTLLGKLNGGGSDFVALTLKRMEVLMLRLKISSKEGIAETRTEI